MNGEPETSMFRQACIAAITSRALREPSMRPVLVDWLDDRTYEERGDGELIEFAERVGVPAERRTQLALLDTTRVPDFDRRVWCPACADTYSVDRGDGRYIRCPMCNPEMVEAL